MMSKRFVSIWFPHLCTDWLAIRHPEWKEQPFVIAAPIHGRMIISAVSFVAMQLGLEPGMRLADAKVLVNNLEVFDEKPGRQEGLLKKIGEWCIRYSPIVALHPQKSLLLEVSGCTHLWGGEKAYLQNLNRTFKAKGYTIRAAIADTPGCAWAVAHFGRQTPLIPSGEQKEALAILAPEALRLDPVLLDRLRKLGFRKNSQFMNMKRSVLRRRFGDELLNRLDQALGLEVEPIIPLKEPLVFSERLPCLEPIRTKTGIEIAISKLLEALCLRLKEEGKGIRSALLKCYRMDGKIEQTLIGTSQPSHNVAHLFKLFELKVDRITPALGIELFTMEALKVEDTQQVQEAIWTGKPGLEDHVVAELLDRLAGKMGAGKIHRYLPQEHHWPERSIKKAGLRDPMNLPWRNPLPRPVQLLLKPEPIEVSAPIPDYPPMLFRHQGMVHHIKKADGPERIEREWWIEEGEHRDYYSVEDQEGRRYWLFRSGHYEGPRKQWFLHGFFA